MNGLANSISAREGEIAVAWIAGDLEGQIARPASVPDRGGREQLGAELPEHERHGLVEQAAVAQRGAALSSSLDVRAGSQHGLDTHACPPAACKARS